LCSKHLTPATGIAVIAVVRAHRAPLVKVVHLGTHIVGQETRFRLHAVHGIVEVVVGRPARGIRIMGVVYMGDFGF